MIQENKDLLVKDLSCRIPYRVCVEHISGFRGILHDITMYFTYNNDDTIKDYLCYTNFFKDEPCKIEFFKPYLYPLSSIEELGLLEEYNHIVIGFNNEDIISVNYIDQLLDFYHRNHLDYNGLISKGLAINCINLNIY
jgi:hypothetical protein